MTISNLEAVFITIERHLNPSFAVMPHQFFLESTKDSGEKLACLTTKSFVHLPFPGYEHSFLQSNRRRPASPA